MSNVNKILLLFFFFIIAFIMVGLSVISGGDITVVGLAIFMVATSVFLFYHMIIADLKLEKEIEYYQTYVKPKVEAQRDIDCVERQKEMGLPTQEGLQAIADSFGFTLHGKMEVEKGKYKTIRFKMETNKSIEQLINMGINTYRDIFGEYYLCVGCGPLHPNVVKKYDDHFNQRFVSDENNMVFYFDYNPKYDSNIEHEADDYIVQITEKDDGFYVYKKSGLVIRNKKTDLSEEETAFIIKSIETELGSGFRTKGVLEKVYTLRPKNRFK